MLGVKKVCWGVEKVCGGVKKICRGWEKYVGGLNKYVTRAKRCAEKKKNTPSMLSIVVRDDICVGLAFLPELSVREPLVECLGVHELLIALSHQRVQVVRG